MKNYIKPFYTFLVAGVLALSVSCSYEEIAELASTDVSFSTEVKAIVDNNCLGCHSGGSSSGGLGFVDDPQQLIDNGYVVKGDSTRSTFYKKLTTSPPFGVQMPKNGPYLSASELASVASWIDGLPAGTNTNPPATVSFATDIVPILTNATTGNANGCIVCHDSTTPSSGYALTADDVSATYASVVAQNVVAGSPDTSLLYLKLTATPPSGSQMPRNGPNYLSASEIQKIYDWINQGALDN